ncbi:MAG: hypothetical protein LUB63_00520, partial [Oscillospiraceae bacterium]|nr:hypothetical protein [Oscillospiraceae bacterium]
TIKRRRRAKEKMKEKSDCPVVLHELPLTQKKLWAIILLSDRARMPGVSLALSAFLYPNPAILSGAGFGPAADAPEAWILCEVGDQYGRFDSA